LTNQDNIDQLVNKPATWNEKFSILSIHFLEDHPGLAANPSLNVWGWSCKDQNAYVVPTEGGQSALMAFCRSAYERWPFLHDIEYPPAWAVDPGKDQTKGPQYYDGYGCANLGISDSTYQYSISALMLHELMHFPGLFADVPGYADHITTEFSKDIPHFISDFDGPYPPHGYGPWGSKIINSNHPKDKRGLAWKGIWNADNFACYAASKYWEKTCGMTFQVCPNRSAAWKNRREPPWPF
jgi:hypothetical protein